MSSIAAIVPFGPDYRPAGDGRRWVGLLGCHRCAEWQLVRLQKNGLVVYAACDDAIITHKCGASYGWPAGDMIDQPTVDQLNAFAAEIAEMGVEYRSHLARSWGLTIEQLETIANGAPQRRENPAQPAVVTETPEPARPEPPAGNSGAAGTGTGAGTVNKPAPGAGNSDVGPGGVPGPIEPASPGPGGTGPGGRTPKRHWADSVFDALSGGR
jgi:hypothetical protein